MGQETQRVTSSALRIPLSELAQDPPSPSIIELSNQMGRVLANLMGFDGTISRLLRATANGVLRVVPENASGTVYPAGLAAGDYVRLADPTTVAQKLKINAGGRAGVVVRDETTDAQALKVSADGRAGVVVRDGTTDAQALIISALGRLGATIRDPSTDAQALLISPNGRPGVTIRNESVDSRALSINPSGEAPVYLSNLSLTNMNQAPGIMVNCWPLRTAGDVSVEKSVAGSTLDYHDFGSTYTKLVHLTCQWASILCYDSATSGAKTTPCGICGGAHTLVFRHALRYLDLDNASASVNKVHIRAWLIS